MTNATVEAWRSPYVPTPIDEQRLQSALSFSRTVSTGHSANRTTFSATDPNTQRSRPADLRAEITIKPASFRFGNENDRLGHRTVSHYDANLRAIAIR